MQLQVLDYRECVIVYGDMIATQQLCDQLLALRINVECIVCESDLESYQGIRIENKSFLAQIQNVNRLHIVVADVRFGTRRREIESINSELTSCICRDNEFLAELLASAEIIDPPEVKKPDKPHSWMGMNQNFVLGGIESWVAGTFQDLKNVGVQCKIIEPMVDNEYVYVGAEFYGINPEDVLQIGPYNNFVDYTLDIIELICKNPPEIFIDNGNFRTITAIYLAKMRLGIPIKVISVIHSDASVFYNRLRYFSGCIDRVIAVNENIQETILNLFPALTKKVIVKQRLPKSNKDSLSTKPQNGCLEIAYVSRLEAGNKRSLWVKDVAMGLLQKQIDFVLHIVGDGDCFKELQSFSLENELRDKIRLYGRIPYHEMNSFYSDKHVFIYFSKREGAPLALLEAMSHGLIPVITDAGPAKQLIHEGIDGYIIDSPEQVVDCLRLLSGAPDKVTQMCAATIHALNNYTEAQGEFITSFM